MKSNFYPTDRTDLPENTRELLIALHFEFYGGPKAHADAFRILPRVANALDKLDKLRALGVVYKPPSDWSYAKNGSAPELSDFEEIDLSSI